MFRLMHSRRFVTHAALALTLGTLVHGSAVHADYVAQTVTLDQSNVLKNGVNYGSVLIEAFDGIGAGGGGLKNGEVRLTYTANIVPDYTSVSKTFGIGEVGFNTNLSLAPGQISGPLGWNLGNKKSLSAFGSFSWDLSGSAKDGSRPNPVTVLIAGLGTDATLDHFLLGSQGNGKQPPPAGSVYFAMQVAGFSTKDNSDSDGQFVGGSTILPPDPGGSGEIPQAPEPSTLLLYGVGFGCLVLSRFAPRRRPSPILPG